MAYQIQVRYRNKIRQFYLSKQVGYAEFYSCLRSNVPSLCDEDFQVLYTNDEGSQITLSDNEFDMSDMYRCAASVSNAEYLRIKIGIVEGCSPATICARKGSEDKGEHTLEPKRLRFDETRVNESDGTAAETQVESNIPETIPDYVSPQELDIQLKTREMDELKVELECVQKAIDAIQTDIPQVQRDPTRRRCGLCHMQSNHTRDKCPNGRCVSAKVCGDINHRDHIDERTELNKLGKQRDDLQKQIDKKLAEIDTRKKLFDAVNSSFERQTEASLINSDKNRYLVMTSIGSQPRRYLLNEDISILKAHFHGKVPENLTKEKMKFQTILQSYRQRHQKKRHNPVRELLENNSKYNVRFPTSTPRVQNDPEDSTVAKPTAETVCTETPRDEVTPNRSTPMPIAATNNTMMAYQHYPQWMYPLPYYYYDTTSLSSTPIQQFYYPHVPAATEQPQASSVFTPDCHRMDASLPETNTFVPSLPPERQASQQPPLPP